MAGEATHSPVPAPEDYFWGSCTVEDSWDVGRYRHLILIGGIHTRCGATASLPEVWERGHPKRQCEKCLATMTDAEKSPPRQEQQTA